MNISFLALGSNLDNPERQLRLGIERLATLAKSSVIKQSRIYHSLPANAYGQPNYCNMVIKLYTQLSPLELLKGCQQIELSSRRYNKNLNGARTLDIDILLYNQRTINKPDLIIPHSRMTGRDFVLLPLLEIAAQIKLPDNSRVEEFLDKCPKYVFKISK